MATVHNHIDTSTNTPWISTYSRALSSIYGTDEDHCWDYLLSTPAISSSASAPESRATTPSNNANSNSLNSLYYNNSDMTMASTLAPLSPASLSHALCKFGFDCIDYFTSTQLDDDEDDNDNDKNNRKRIRKNRSQPPTPAPSPSAEASSHSAPVYTNPMLDELTDSDWRTGLAAAVCGKRTAALERKRALSRTMSQEEFLSGQGSSPSSSTLAPLTAANIAAMSSSNNSATLPDRQRKRDQWFETFDRLARWDEVAYR
ncbi:hypothetical protein FBU30_010779 [Linnemannia zychae]|nr:hypothetical protein FBU30_010779 [Linnemannia zychae]